MDQEFLNKMIEWMDSELDETINELSYTGFNPVDMRQRLLNDGVNITDVGIILTFCINRGTNINKACKRMSKAGVDKLKAAATRLGISSSKNIRAEPDKLTVSRLSACFPEICSMIIGRSGRVENNQSDLAPHLQFPQARCLIYHETIAKEWEEWSIAFTNKIGGDAEEQKKFWKIQADSNMFSIDEKRNFENPNWWTLNASIGRKADDKTDVTRSFATVANTPPQLVTKLSKELTDLAMSRLHISESARKNATLTILNENSVVIDGIPNKRGEILGLVDIEGKPFRHYRPDGTDVMLIYKLSSGTWSEINSKRTTKNKHR